MNIEQYVRRRVNCSAKKFTLEIIDGTSAPVAYHEDGVTRWKNGRPKSYERAVNELRVGRDWLIQHLPATWAERRLSGSIRLHGDLLVSEGDLQRERHQIDLAIRAQRAAQDMARNADAWARIERRHEMDRDTDPDESRLYA